MIRIKLIKSPMKGKKWRVFISNSFSIDFGSEGYSDYTIHKDKYRKTLYLLRHSGVKPNFITSRRENWSKDGYKTRGFWSRWLLWNELTINESIVDIMNRFDILVIKSINNRGGNRINYKTIFEKESKDIYTPNKYFEGLNYKEKLIRLRRIKKGVKMNSKDKEAYKEFETDFKDGKRIETKVSGYTKQWNKYYPNSKSLEDKSKLTGVSIDILDKIYKKGNAAWRTGHRPGANQYQWGHARVNSFLVKGKTFYTADNKLAKEALRCDKAKRWFNSIKGLCDEPNPNSWCGDKINFAKE